MLVLVKAYGKMSGGDFGGLGEWLNPPDCKSGARKGYVGSNPTPSTTELMLRGKVDRPG